MTVASGFIVGRARLFLAACLCAYGMLLLAGAPGVARAETLFATAQDEARLTIETAGGAHVFQVEIADNDSERSRGLMYRRTLAADHGMLFDFIVERPVAFWMKNTYVSLDMIFIRADGTIERIAERTEPLSEKLVPSDGAVRFVLEVAGGTAERLGIRRGDRIVHPRISHAK